MKRRAGQAGRIIAEAFHQLGRIMLLALLLLLLGVCALGLRLSAGPIELPALASWLATAVSGQGINITVQRADLAWAGYTEGGGVPFYLRLGGISVRNAAQLELVNIPSARLVVVPSALFGGGDQSPVLVSGTQARFNGSNVPVTLDAKLAMARGFVLARADIRVTLGPGRLGAGQMSVPISGGGFTLDFTPQSARLSQGMLHLAASAGAAPVLAITGTAALDHVWQAQVHITGDRVQARDLPRYWPPALIPKTRDWVLHNITAGTATHGDFTFSLSAPPTLTRIAIANVTGGFDGRDLTLAWLPGAIPITGLSGRFQMPDRDEALVTAQAATLAGLVLDKGSFTITGIAGPEQTGHLDVALHGGVAAALGVLAAPPINLLRHAPRQITMAQGDATATVRANIPFRPQITLRQVDLHVEAMLHNVSLAPMLPGLPLTKGDLRVVATGTTLRLYGGAQFAGAPMRISLLAGLTGAAGLQDFTMAGAAGPGLMASLGLARESTLVTLGAAAVPFMVQISPAGGTDNTAQLAALILDLTPASLALPRFGWAKKAGQAGRVDLHIMLDKGAVTGLRDASVTAPDLDLRVRSAGGRIIIARADIGRTRAQGQITPPNGPGQPWQVLVSGPMLDLRAMPDMPAHPSASAPPTSPPTLAPTPAGKPTGPYWQLKLNFGALALSPSPAPELAGFTLTATGQGGTMQGATGAAGGVSLIIGRDAGGRTALGLRTADGGALLNALGLSREISGGDLVLNADYGAGADTQGRLTLKHFRLMDAPVFTKVLQAATIYGVGAATSGPGLSFARAVVPFKMTDDALYLDGARAFSASLGFTASGRIALGHDDIDLDCTIIPAYALNALPGKIPLLGHLFTAEAGGGLFAVRAHVTGSRADPQISVNPLSVLAPGVLRDVFGGSGESAPPTTGGAVK
ncbi:MAG: DUF3971 domain-containing protein [Acidocella sp.]|nr:DUF3971 domain-containing protein [Acidocella sp.]